MKTYAIGIQGILVFSLILAPGCGRVASKKKVKFAQAPELVLESALGESEEEILLEPEEVRGVTILVGPDESWSSIVRKLKGAKAGMQVLLKPGTYDARGSIWLSQNGRPDSKIMIRAQDPNDRPIWKGSAIRSRDCWQIHGDYYEISGIIFDGCKRKGSAGIRAVNTRGLTVRGSEFRNGYFGLSGAAVPFVIEDNQIHHNSNHNLYIYGGTLQLRRNHLHHAGGQNLHDRAVRTLAELNWFSSPGSYSIDLMYCNYLCGGATQQRLELRGNVIEAGAPSNRSQLIALFADEGTQDGPSTVDRFELLMAYNTVIGIRGTAQTHLLTLRNDTIDTHAELYNNVVTDVDWVAEVSRPRGSNWSIRGDANWMGRAPAMGDLRVLPASSNPGFVSSANRDYRPKPGSLLAGKGLPALAAPPSSEIRLGSSGTISVVPRANGADVGAFLAPEIQAD